MSMAVDQTRNRLLVVNSNFDLAFRAASVVVVDTATHHFASGFAAVGSFPGDLVVAEPGGSGSMAGYVTVRGNNSLTWFTMTSKSGELSFECGADGASGCDEEFVVVEGELPSDEGDPVETALGSDPFGLGFFPPEGSHPGLLLVAAMKTGTLNLMTVADDGAPTLVGQEVLSSGLHSLVTNPQRGTIYMTTKSYPQLYRFVVEWDEDSPELNRLANVILPAPYTTGDYGRGLALAQAGDTILVSYRNPSGILVVKDADEMPEHSQGVVRFVVLGSRPGQVRVFPTGPGGLELAYVVCYGDDAVWVVDPVSYQVVDKFSVGAGPYDMVFMSGDDFRRGYISNFLDHTISVVDLDPASPYYHQQIAEIH